ncbi:ABC transporter ATP-binding protein [Bacillus sp. RO1]|uniref:ABC transporter ATP-binding protein n=1 Tax=Bacillus sp. RO1 TaxID=2722703 RepID=UPI00197BC114|nr:ABC transporter ATP-binding protein [Bacillus sp. RO1]
MMSLLEVKNLKTYFHTKDGIVKAVDDVSFTLEKGEAIGLVGESGCGKTTTALSITSLLPQEGEIAGGEINFNGKNLAALNDNQIRRYRWNEIAIAFQGAMNALNPVKKIGEQLTDVMMYHNKLDYKAARKKAKGLLELVEIDPERIDQYPHEFSGGMKQRVMIAMALACDPKILIGDEPTTALDVMVQAQILELLEKLRAELGMSLILITHDLSVMAETCDKAVVMYAGKIVETGTVENVIKHSSHPYTQKLVKAFPDIHGKREMTESIPGSPPNLINPPTGCYFHPRCEHATEECKRTTPALRKIAEDHYVACHLRGE